MKVKEESEKVGLKINIQKAKIMASGPITSWPIDGETVETVWDCMYLGSKITAEGDCSHEIKRRLLLGRKAMSNLDSILKSRDITLPTKVHLVKAVVFPLVMYGCESWTVKKAEHQRIAAFELWCWRRLSRVPRTPWRSNQSILKEICPEYSLEGLMLKLKLQYFGHMMPRADELEKSPSVGKDWRQEKGMTEDEMVGWHDWLNGHEFEQALGDGEGQGSLVCCSPWSRKESDTTEPLNSSSTSTFSSIQHHRVHSDFLPFLSVVPLLTVRNLTSITLSVFTYFVNPPLGANIHHCCTPSSCSHTLYQAALPDPCLIQPAWALVPHIGQLPMNR